jgi:hypothetical protein
MTPSNKNEIIAFWESDAVEIELPHTAIYKEIEPMGARPVLAIELECLGESSKENDSLLDVICNKYRGDWYYRQDGTYYIYFTDPDDAVWFVNDAVWDINNGYYGLNEDDN